MSITAVPLQAAGPTLGQVAHDYWQELVVVKMDGAALYWNAESRRWSSRLMEATCLTRREASQQFPDWRVQGFTVTFKNLS